MGASVACDQPLRYLRAMSSRPSSMRTTGQTMPQSIQANRSRLTPRKHHTQHYEQPAYHYAEAPFSPRPA